MNMDGVDQHNIVDDLPMEQALIVLADELGEFVSINAFLVNSMASLISSEHGVNFEVIEGARYFSDDSQARALKIKETLNLILSKSKDADGNTL
jgi:hypothetical protein